MGVGGATRCLGVLLGDTLSSDFLTLNVLRATGIQMLFMRTHTGDLLPTHFWVTTKEHSG